MGHVSIQELYRGAKNGNSHAERMFFQVLSERFRAFTEFKTGDISAAQDIVQMALMTVADKYRGAAPMDDVVPWAHRILLNHIMHYFREKGQRSGREVQLSEVHADRRTGNVDPLLKIKLRECLKRLHGVNERHARILNLRYQGYSTAEITEKLAMSRNAFYISLSRARTMLQECLEKGAIAHE